MRSCGPLTKNIYAQIEKVVCYCLSCNLLLSIMRRRAGPDTPDHIAKKIAEGRGRGAGSAYAPWIKVGEIRSSGEQRILRGRKTGRLHHYFSRGESNHHLFAEFSQKVVDIREQFPVLPIDNSLEVARKLGIRHPQFAGTPTVVTFDFLLTIRDGNAHRHLVRSVKRSDDLKKHRVLEKLTLERQLCLELGFGYEIVTELQMGAVPLANLTFLWQWTRLKRPDPDPLQQQIFLQILRQQDFQNPLAGCRTLP
jgi:TnsA endonuclease N terminal